MKTRVQMTMDDETVKKADKTAATLGMSRSAYVSFLINMVDEITVSSSVTPNDVAMKLTATQKK